MSQQQVEEIMKRINSHKGVKALIIINKDGLLLKTNMEMNATTEQLIKNIHELSLAARRLIRDVDPRDDLLFLRTLSEKDEILISPAELSTLHSQYHSCEKAGRLSCLRDHRLQLFEGLSSAAVSVDCYSCFSGLLQLFQ